MPNARQSSPQFNIFIRNAPAKRALNRNGEPRTFLRGDCHASSLHSSRGIRSAASLNAANGVLLAASRLPLYTVGDKQGRASYTAPRSTHQQGSAPGALSTHTRPAKPGGHHDTTSRITSGTPALRSNSSPHLQSSGAPESRGVAPHPDNLQTPERHEQRQLRRVRQDKGFLTKALSASHEPAPHQKGGRAHFVNKDTPRSQKPTARVKLVHTTLWLHPLVRAELARLAELENLSISQVGASLLDKAIRQDIHSQYNALLQPMLKQIIREELRAFGNRLVFFLMRIAFASEQARILVTNILCRALKREGAPDKTFTSLLDQSSKMARRNIITKSPQLEALLEAWEGFGEEGNGEDSQTTDQTLTQERSQWQS